MQPKLPLTPKRSGSDIPYEKMAETEDNMNTSVAISTQVTEEIAYGNNSDGAKSNEIVYDSDKANTNNNDTDVKEKDTDNNTNANNDDQNETKEKENLGPIGGVIQRQDSDDESEQDDPNSVLLFTYLDKDQDVIEKTKNKKRPDSVLNKVDPDWSYNITIGDVEKRKISNLPGKGDKTMELWFPCKGAVRKVFVALKVKRVSEVDNVAETFRMRFHIYFNWLMTEVDYRSYLQAKDNVEKTKNYDHLLKWEPSWYPHLEFQNAIEEHIKEWEVYPEQGRFRLQEFKDFGKNKGEKIDKDKFDCQAAKFIRAKLECEMTFAEELELQSFPFDCQDLSCVIHERTTGGVQCRFLPELRKPNFASVDPRYSVIDEWDLETAILEFGDANASASRSKTTYAMIILRLKMKRRWKVFLWNIVFLMMCICALALCSFALEATPNGGDLGERLNLIITLVLTAVAFSYVVFDNLPNVPYLTFMDKYILAGYSFLVATMIQSSLVQFLPEQWDGYFFWIGFVVFIGYHIGFAYYATILRKDEEEKLYLSSDDVEREVNLSRPSLEFNYEQRLRAGDGGRLLSFLGTIKIPDTMKADEQVKLRLQQEKLKQIYEERAKKLDQQQHFHQSSLLNIQDDKGKKDKEEKPTKK